MTDTFFPFRAHSIDPSSKLHTDPQRLPSSVSAINICEKWEMLLQENIIMCKLLQCFQMVLRKSNLKSPLVIIAKLSLRKSMVKRLHNSMLSACSKISATSLKKTITAPRDTVGSWLCCRSKCTRPSKWGHDVIWMEIWSDIHFGVCAGF